MRNFRYEFCINVTATSWNSASIISKGEYEGILILRGCEKSLSKEIEVDHSHRSVLSLRIILLRRGPTKLVESTGNRVILKDRDGGVLCKVK